MKDFTNFNKSALRAVLRKSDRLICQPTEGRILICTGYCIWALSPAEYADIAQPVTHLEPGNWERTSSGRKDSDFDISRFFNSYADKARTAGTVAAEAAARFPNGKTVLSAYYTEKTVAAFNSDYVGTVADPIPMLTGELDPVVFVSQESGPVAVVLPVRIKPEISAAVRALHSLEDPAAETAENREAAENEIAALRAELAEAQQTAEAAKAAAQAQPATVEAKPQNNIDVFAARFAEIPGIVVTVKGAQTAAPVAWLSGETQAHADELKAAGAKWSQKRSAYYFKIA